MSERVFTVTGSAATAAQPITLAEAGLRERSDLQEWVLAHPEIIGDGVLVVTFEFDRWQGSGGARERDRLDVLGIGADGRLVVAELKRDRAPDTVEMQAIKYAAMTSRFTEDSLVEQHARFLARNGGAVDQETARQRLIEHAGDLDPEQLRRPRIVLVAGSFPPVVTATVVWLTEMGVDLAPAAAGGRGATPHHPRAVHGAATGRRRIHPRWHTADAAAPHRGDLGGSRCHRRMGQPGPTAGPRPLVQRPPPAACLGV